MSSSGVHGPFLTPSLSQHGDLPMLRTRYTSSTLFQFEEDEEVDLERTSVRG